MSNQIQQAKGTSGATLKSLIQAQAPAFKMALGKPELADAFVRSALTLVNMNHKLAECQPMSFLGALMQAAQLKLDLSLGQAWIIPYWSSKNGGLMAQFQIGYQGMIDLFYRHQLASELYAEIVYANDKFEYSLGTSRNILHHPTLGDRGEMIAVYAIARLSSGASNIVVMSVAELIRYKQHYSKPDQQGRYGVWDSDFEAMAKKTAIKQVLKYMPKAVEIQRAMVNDGAVVKVASVANLDLDRATITQLTDESDTHLIESPEPAKQSNFGLTAPPEPPEKKQEAPIVEIVKDAPAEEINIGEIKEAINESIAICKAQQIPGYADESEINKVIIKYLGASSLIQCTNFKKLQSLHNDLQKQVSKLSAVEG
jgi:recombination protein RecT